MDAAPVHSPPTLDPAATARWAAMPAPLSPWLHEEVARRMVTRLDWIKAQPARWCHWEATRGGLAAHALVAQRYPKAACHVYEPQAGRRVQAQGQLLPHWWQWQRWAGPGTMVAPTPPQGVQMLWANMALHASAQPMQLLQQWHAALAVDGFLMFSCLGPDTARELRAAYSELGWGPAGHEFTDMHDWGDMLLQAGFAEPVMDMERVVLTYERPEQLVAELRTLGRNWHPARFGGLRTPRWRDRLYAALGQRLRHDGQRLALTFEVVYGHALKPEPRLTVSSKSHISLEQMRSALRRGPARPG